MADEDKPKLRIVGGFNEAIDHQPIATQCPFCGESAVDMLKREGLYWICACCSRQWLANTRADDDFLKVNKIQP